MADAIVGTGSIVGFDVDGDNRGGGRGLRDLHTTIDRGEQTRDILQAVRFEAEHARDAAFDTNLAVEKVGQAAELATEKTAAALSLAVEKIGAAGILAAEKTSAALNLSIEKTAAASQLQAAQIGSGAQLFAAQNHAAALAQAAECCCELKELVRDEAGRTRDLINTIESNRVRDALTDAKTEILALRLGAGGNGNGNNVR